LACGLAIALGVASVAHGARAQDRRLDLTRSTPPLDGQGFLNVQATATPGHGRVDTTLALDYVHRPLVVTRGDGSRAAVVADRFVADVAVQVGLGGRLAVAAAAPFVLWQSGDGRALDGRPLPSVAVGDPRLSVRYRLLGESADVRRERNEGPGLALQLVGWLPVGDTDALLGEGAARLAALLLADFHVLGLGVGGVLGYRHRFEPRSLAVARFASDLELGLGLKVPIPILRDFQVLLDGRLVTDSATPLGRAQTAGEVDLGARVRVGDFTFTGATGLGLGGGVGVPTVRGMLTTTWSPREHDKDSDGIADDRDQCPPLPEDFDGYQDEDGCPDPDDDGDLVLDADDRCPREAALEGRDEDEDGCTDPVRDADGDGVPDGEDACPGDAEDRDGVEDDDGCPDPDDDRDGVPDARDRCPTQREDRDGFEDDDGCPDPDDDGDGVSDADDRCPREPEDRDGFEDDDGCPDLDDDEDGIPDAADRCPREPETVNGAEDDDGCPDRGGRALWRVAPATADDAAAGARPSLEGTIAFDAAGAVAPASRGAVAQLALLLRGRMARGRAQAVVMTAAGDAEARQRALTEALRAAGVDVTRVTMVRDNTVRGARVRVDDVVPAPATPTAAPPAGSTTPPASR
jgi:hypothetical protein